MQCLAKGGRGCREGAGGRREVRRVRGKEGGSARHSQSPRGAEERTVLPGSSHRQLFRLWLPEHLQRQLLGSAMASKRASTEAMQGHMAKKQAKLAQVRQGGVDLTYQGMLDELQCHLRAHPHKIPLVLRYAEKMESDPGCAREEARGPSGIPMSRTTLGSVSDGTLRTLLGKMSEKLTMWAPKVNKSKDKDLWLHLVCAATQSSPSDKITNAQHKSMDDFYAFYLRKHWSLNKRLLPDLPLVYNHEQGFDWQRHGLYALVGLREDGTPDHGCARCTHVLYKGTSAVTELCSHITFERSNWFIENNWSDEGAQLVSKNVPKTTILMKDLMAQLPDWPQRPRESPARSDSAKSLPSSSASSSGTPAKEPGPGFAQPPEDEREEQ